LGKVPEGLLPPNVALVERRPLPTELLDAAGRIPVMELVRIGEDRRRQLLLSENPEDLDTRQVRPAEAGNGRSRVLVLTDRDLAMPGCDFLFGFAERKRGVAVVSTFRLGGASDPITLAGRARNEIAHELGHLEGLRHCANADCVMRLVRSVPELDTRPHTTCGRCPRAKRLSISSGVAITAAVLLAFAGLDAGLGPLLGPGFQAPFT
jgi:hypothetical protein